MHETEADRLDAGQIAAAATGMRLGRWRPGTQAQVGPIDGIFLHSSFPARVGQFLDSGIAYWADRGRVHVHLLDADGVIADRKGRAIARPFLAPTWEVPRSALTALS